MRRLTDRGGPGLPVREAPWTDDELDQLRGFQKEPLFLPFACSTCKGKLEAFAAGWHCAACDRIVCTIAYEYMTTPAWRTVLGDVLGGRLISGTLDAASVQRRREQLVGQLAAEGHAGGEDRG